jgi:hypothetical protein
MAQVADMGARISQVVMKELTQTGRSLLSTTSDNCADRTNACGAVLEAVTRREVGWKILRRDTIVRGISSLS